MLESYGLIAFLLLAVGLTILVAEVFLPSGGILAIITTITLCTSLAFAYAAWYQRNPALWWAFCGLVVLTIPSTLGGAFYILPRTSMGRRILLEAPELERLEPHAQETARLEKLVGQYGKTISLLAPGGMVKVGDERLHAFSEGQMIDANVSVRILEVRGTRVLVQPAQPPIIPAAQELAQGESSPPVDFDLPPE